MSVLDDVERLFAQLRRPQPPASIATIHHPKCAALRSRRAEDCNCGGSAFPASHKSRTTEPGA